MTRAHLFSRTVRAAIAVSLSSWGLAVGCTSGDITIFEAGATSTSTGGGGGSTGGMGGNAGLATTTAPGDAGLDADIDADMDADAYACKDWPDCPPGQFCSKESCAAESGKCVPPPVVCDPAPNPTCGCNGVNYWNDCVRQQALVVASTPGQCTAGRKCVYNGDCRLYGVLCSRLLFQGQPCPTPGEYVEGQCWGMPPLPVCEKYDDPQRWQLCTPPDTPPVECQQTCFSIISQLPHRRILDESMCPSPG